MKSRNFFATILFLGDSLTAGYGVAPEQSWPALIEQRAHTIAKFQDSRWINASISGSTSKSGPSRLNWALRSQKPDLIFLALGANDGLRGQSISELEKNLSETVEIAQKSKIKVILAGIKIPTNMGPKFRQDFESVFPKVSKKYKIQFVPFLLEGVAGNPKLNLPDGIHPNPEGHKIIANQLWKIFETNLSSP